VRQKLAVARQRAPALAAQGLVRFTRLGEPWSHAALPARRAENFPDDHAVRRFTERYVVLCISSRESTASVAAMMEHRAATHIALLYATLGAQTE